MTSTVGYAPEEVEAIAVWLKDAMSASQIAALLSDERRCHVSRNAIIGIVHRNADLRAIGFARGRGMRGSNVVKARAAKREVTLRHEPGKRRYGDLTPAEKERLQLAYLPGRAFLDATADTPPTDMDLLMLRAPTPPPRPRPEINPAAYDAGSRHLPITDLGRGDCRYPVNDAAPGGLHLFCGAAVAGETSYCAHHAARCFGVFVRAA